MIHIATNNLNLKSPAEGMAGVRVDACPGSAAASLTIRSLAVLMR